MKSVHMTLGILEMERAKGKATKPFKYIKWTHLKKIPRAPHIWRGDNYEAMTEVFKAMGGVEGVNMK